MIAWAVLMRAANGRDESGESITGVAVLITDGTNEWEISRVAFNRRVSANPGKMFDTVLREEMEKAQTAADVMNDALDDFDRAKADAQYQWREKIREVLGEPAGIV